MSADDGGASGSGIGPTGLRRENSAAVFATTHWSVVLEAQGESPAAQDALEKLCRTYWRPVYSFIRRQGVGIEEAIAYIREKAITPFGLKLVVRRHLAWLGERALPAS